jgi:ariadne-1
MMSTTKSGHCRRLSTCRPRRSPTSRLCLRFRYVQLTHERSVRADQQSSTAAILLRHFVWNSEKLQEQFWNDPAGVFQEAGLSPPSSPSQSTRPLPQSPRARPRNAKSSSSASIKRSKPSVASLSSGPFECPICCCEFPREELDKTTMAMGCEHRFCVDCWTEYLAGKVAKDGESSKIQCMESGCDRIIKGEIVDRFVSPEISKK